MSVIFLTVGGDTRETALREAIAAKGWEVTERYAFSDPEVCAWGIVDPPCVIKLYDGRAVWECADPVAAAGWSWNWVKGEHTKAVNAYIAAQEPQP